MELSEIHQGDSVSSEDPEKRMEGQAMKMEPVKSLKGSVQWDLRWRIKHEKLVS